MVFRRKTTGYGVTECRRHIKDNMDDLVDIFRRHARPLEPIATGASPQLPRIEGVRAVMFDVYGTLLISASGEVGTVRAASEDALSEALAAAGVRLAAPVAEGAELLFSTIRARHGELRSQGIEYPEVDICGMWQRVLDELVRRGLVEAAVLESCDPRRLAIEYEARANPCWPMPRLEACLERIAAAGMMTGIVSNAQFYTPLLFPALTGKTLPEWGFDPGLLFYSYEQGYGKPGMELYRRAAAALKDRGVEPAEVIYVGNDMLNDVMPAATVGFRTALFAGDRRSLRLREEDPRVEGISPDSVLTDLGQLVDCLFG